MRPVLLKAEGLTKHFGSQPSRFGAGLFGADRPVLRAVDGVDLEVRQGETMGIVGESGCGKSTMGRLLVRLLEATAGRVQFDGIDLLTLKGRALTEIRRDLGMVFQDPWASLDGRMRVRDIIAEPLDIHRAAAGAERRRRVAELLEVVGLPASAAEKHPHQFSGGQRQRIGIARALSLKPRFIVLDEAVSALDVSVQAQILQLLADLQREFGLTFLFISHNLAVVRNVADRVAVMYLGRVVESGPTQALFEAPRHPYTQALLSAIPVPDPERPRTRVVLKGDVPSALAPPAGCRFHTRCPMAQDICRQTPPPTVAVGPDHSAACHFAASSLMN
ncbi:peptide ABC transporter ATP-binding protein [Aliidongia dinghuensis]|uniref:Peptide ABC transporter ATP-binding protein n=2 Tax=Aliidongia dinghuensis TaxID=1867774 RepID=A0A8J2YXQ9_9PROT|nr:peptide ABC transporter ATP-binding protein [Aliidongia dinghuensis]